MEQPLILAYLPHPAAQRALDGAGWELKLVDAGEQILTAPCPRHPRLLILQVTPLDVEAMRDLVAASRRERPLTDILVWAPQARGAAVRQLFRAGAKDVMPSRSPAKLLESAQRTLEGQQILPRMNDLSRRRSRSSRFESMLSRSAAMWDLFDLCTRIAPVDATVLIVGETGTGKDLLARALHRRSQRKGRFVAANCASIAAELVNSELFGHEKGAFTGADRAKKGLVTHAHQGTLFLDEIGDMPGEAQQSLLRMLQERRIRPVGSLMEQEIDVRVVAATNVSLDEAVRDGHFREDLFYRLDVIRMNVPPLRERREDILFLFGAFAKRLSKHYGLNPPTFSESFLDALLEYSWPGNVRELENFSERLVLARPQRVLAAGDFSKLQTTSLAEDQSSDRDGRGIVPTVAIDIGRPLQQHLDSVLEQHEREYLQAVLRQHQGRVGEAAQQAGISRRTLLRKMTRYQLDKRAFKPQ